MITVESIAWMLSTALARKEGKRSDTQNTGFPKHREEEGILPESW